MKKCTSGYYTYFKAATCSKCPAGSYCADPSIPPRACPELQYSVEGASECSDCPLGAVCQQGLIKSQCKPGELCNPSLFTVQLPCPAGYYCPDPSLTDLSSANLCPLGTYSKENSTSCTPCPPGSYCPTPAMLP